MQNANKDQYILQSVDNALEIIDILSEKPQMRIIDIAKKMGIGKTTAFRLLATLEKRGYVFKDRSNKYSLSFRFVSLGNAVRDRIDSSYLIHPYLEELAERCGETTHLVQMQDALHIVYMDKVRGSATIILDTSVGSIKLAHMSATGKALLAYASKDSLDNYLNNTSYPITTPYSLKSKEEVMNSLSRVRKAGFSSCEQEDELGVTAYAAPLFDTKGHAFASISIAGPSERMAQHKEENTQILIEIAERLNHSLGVR